MEVFLQELVGQGRLSRVQDIFAQIPDLDAYYLELADLVNELHDNDNDDITVRTRIVASEAHRAIALADVHGDSDRVLFVYLVTAPSTGLVQGIIWSLEGD